MDNFKEKIKKFLEWSGFAFLIILVIIGLVVLTIWVSTKAKTLLQNMLEDTLVSEFVELESKFRTSEQVNMPGISNDTSSKEIVDTEDKTDLVNQGSQIRDDIVKNGRLVASSFTDLFSGVGWINKEKTTMYHDKIVTAFTFAPNFEWRKISEYSVNKSNFIEKINGNDVRCLNNTCLVQDNNHVYKISKTKVTDYKTYGEKINMPSSISTENLVDVSIGALDTIWVIGLVENKGGKYMANVFYFDGDNFDSVFTRNDPFISRYTGTIGFGGGDNNFLVIYGAYEGQAYHIKNGEAYNISDFFGIRVMNDGFHPVVFKGSIDSGVDTWYVYSMTEGNPKLVKLFQNGSDKIVGAMDLSRSLFTGGLKKALFYFDETSKVLKSKIVRPSGNNEYWEFEDQGFIKESGIISSVNINNYPAEIRQATFTDMDFATKGCEYDLFVSNDGSNWNRVEIGESFSFPDEKSRQLRWKIEFKPKGSKYYSPFLDTIRLNYLVKFF